MGMKCRWLVWMCMLLVTLGTLFSTVSAEHEYVHLVWVNDQPNPGESFSVQYAGFPGNASDWLTVVPVDYPDDRYGEWVYTRGGVDGGVLVSGLPAGHYEVRSYFNWPAGGYEVQARFPFVIGSPGYPQGQLAWTQKQSYEPGEPIVVEYQDMPGNTRDWITIVPWDSADSAYQEYSYLQGQRAGELTFRGLDKGQYQVRVFFNWPSGGYEVRDRHTFWVGMQPPSMAEVAVDQQPPDSLAWTERSQYRIQEPILVHFAGLPGNNRDWITVVRSDAGDSTYGQFYYTGGEDQGSREFRPLAAGHYEVRVFFDWPHGSYDVQSRYGFSVTD